MGHTSLTQRAPLSHRVTYVRWMGRKPPDKRRIARARLAGARARLIDQTRQEAAAEEIAETERTIAALEAQVGSDPPGPRSAW